MRNLLLCLAIVALVSASCGGSKLGSPAASTAPAGPGVTGDGTLAVQLDVIRGRHRLPALAVMAVGTGGMLELGATGQRALGHPEPVTAEDLWHVGSLTKSMTATLAALLVEEGRIRWDTTVSDALRYARAAMRPELASVRLEELLTHTSGIVTNVEDAPELAGDGQERAAAARAAAASRPRVPGALWHNGSNVRWYAIAWLAPFRYLGLFALANGGGDSAAAATDEAVSLLISRFEASGK